MSASCPPKPARADCALPVSAIVGNAEVRRLAGGITRHTLIRWRNRRGFPGPIRTLECGELWDARQVRAWLRSQQPTDD